jgi:hypothetical protein
MNLQRRLLFMMAGVAVVAVLPTIAIFHWNTHHELIRRSETDGVRLANTLSRALSVLRDVPTTVENKLGQQMAATATALAQLVDLSQKRGEPTAQLQQRINKILADSIIDEVWISDADGCARLRPPGEAVFCFNPDPKKQPQAHVFWPLLTGKAKMVIQEPRRREIDDRVFQYVGVPGIDQRRIVQVGNHVAFLESLRQALGLDRLIEELLREPDVLGIWVIDLQGKVIAGQARPESGLGKQLAEQQLSLAEVPARGLGHPNPIAPDGVQHGAVAGGGGVLLDGGSVGGANCGPESGFPGDRPWPLGSTLTHRSGR